MEIKLGNYLWLHPEFGMGSSKETKYIKMLGKIVYIHPKRRFFTAEFEGKLGNFRESYIIPKDLHGHPLRHYDSSF